MAYRPAIRITPHLLHVLEEIAVLRERVVSATVQVSWISGLQRDARVRNTHASTAIEGNPLSLEQVRKLSEGEAVPDAAARSRREVTNYWEALRRIERRRPVTMTLAEVLALHKVIGNGVLDSGHAGRIRTVPIRVGMYVPPPPGEVPRLLRELLDWWNMVGSKWSPVVSSAVVHLRFEQIHPFADGNGRTGRALALWELYRRGFDTRHIFSVDEVLWENRARYYEALNAVNRLGGDVTGWLEFSAEALHLVLERTWERVQRLRQGPAMQKISLRPRQERLLRILSERGPLTPREIWTELEVSKQGALDLLNPLLAAGLVRRDGTRKSGRYALAVTRSKR